MTDNTDTASPQRNLTVSEFLTTDGVMEAPEEWPDDGIAGWEAGLGHLANRLEESK